MKSRSTPRMNASPRLENRRAAIAGGGLMGRWHARAIAQSGATVAAVADLDLGAAQGLAARHRGAQAFGDVGEMLQSVRPDVLHICTPLDTHSFLAERALEAGCHLFIEKPLAPTLGQTQSLLESAARRAKLVCPVHQFAFQDAVWQARRWLPQLGALIHLEATFCSAGGASLPISDLDAIIADILPHPLSLFQVFLPASLPTQDWQIARPARGELRALGLSSGVTLSLFISMNARPTQSALTILGANGKITLDLFHGYAFRQSGKVSRLRKIAHPFDQSLRHLLAASLNLAVRTARGEAAYPGLQRLTRQFYAALQNGAPSPISAEKILEVARLREILMTPTASVSAPASTQRP